MPYIILVVLWLLSFASVATTPILNSSTPSDNDTSVSQTADLILNFSKKLTAVSGKAINLYQSSGSLVESIDVTSDQISITNGDKKVTVDFSNALLGGAGYYINIDPGAFTNSEDPYAGISDSTTLNFTTVADTTAPSATFNPTNGATGVVASSNITLTFDEVIRHTDNDVITNTSVDALIILRETNVSGSNISFDATISGSVITINPTNNFSSEQVVYIGIGASIEDNADNAISATSATFTTADTTAPTITFSPANGATGVSNDSNITLTFNEAIRYINDSTIKNNDIDDIITLKDTNSSGVDIAFDATISGNVITINPDASFSSVQTVYVAISAGVEDSSDNAISAASATFTAALIVTTPTLSSSSPADGATNIATSANIVLNFNEAVDAESGNIYIKKTDGSIIETISATDAKVSGSGSTTITINPSTALDDSTGYYINIDASAFDSSSGGSYAGISNSTTLNFTTADTTAPTITFSPANGATGVSNDSNITLTFNEAIRYINDSTIKNNDIDDIITLKDTNSSGVDIAFDATISGNVITINPDASFSSVQTVYVAISAGVEDSSDNAISAASATFTAANSASGMPKFMETYPNVLQRNIGIDVDIVLDFDQIVFASNNSAGGRNDRKISIYNAATGLAVFNEDSNNLAISGSGTKQITINPPNDLEERINYYIFIGGDAFYDGSGNYYPGISDPNSLRFMTAKDPNKYANVTASNEMHIVHSMNQIEKSINAITSRQDFVRRNGGKNASTQGVKFTFNNPALDDTLNKLAPLVNHFENYDVSRQLANAADKSLPNDWGLWTSGEISLGNVNTDSGIDSTSKSKEISVGLDKVIDADRMAGGAYRINKTETVIGSDGTKMNSNTKTWSVYGSLKTNEHSTFEALMGLGDISTDHTRVDGVNTYTGVRESRQVFACFIARDNLHFKETNLSPFVRIDSSYTQQEAYSETGDSTTAYDALHYKSSNFHNTLFSAGIDADVQYQFDDKTVKPYLSLRHKVNTGYESSNNMYYLSNPVKEYGSVVTSNSGESGVNLVIGVDIQSEDGWIVTSSYELSEYELIHNKSLRFRAEWKF